jgi:hypothetical protein
VWRREAMGIFFLAQEAMGMESDLGSGQHCASRGLVGRGDGTAETLGPINIGFTLLKTNNWFYFLKPNKCFLLGI